MTVLLMATADLPFSLTAPYSASTTEKRTGTKSFYANGAYHTQEHTLSFPLAAVPSTELYWRFCAYSSSDFSLQLIAQLINSAGGGVVSLTTTTTRDVQVRLGGSTGTLLYTITNGLPLNTWQVFELHISTTNVAVRVNGSLVYDAAQTTTVDTTTHCNFRGTSTTNISRWIGYLDDIVIYTDSWPGLGGLHVFTPTGAGSITNWQSSLPTLNTPAQTLNTKHLFTFADAPADGNFIRELGIAAEIELQGQGPGAVKGLFNTTEDSLVPLTVVHGLKHIASHPSMTPAQFNMLEAGVASA